MKKTFKIIITTFILFILDFVLTIYYLNNSNHANEGNPLININDGYLVLAINLIYFLFIIFLAIIIGKYKNVKIMSKNTFDYIKKLYRSDHFVFIFISLAFSFVYASIVSRLIVILDWIIFGIYESGFYSTIYSQIRGLMPLGRYDVIFGFLSFMIFIPIWYKLEYKKSKSPQ